MNRFRKALPPIRSHDCPDHQYRPRCLRSCPQALRFDPSAPRACFRFSRNSFLIILPSHEKNKPGAKKPSPRSRTRLVCEIRDNFFLLRRLGNGLFLCGQHILQKDAVASRRIVHQHVSHGADELSVLNDGRARHALNDASRALQKLRVRDADHEVFRGSVGRMDPFDLHGVFLHTALIEGAADGGRSRRKLSLQGNGKRLGQLLRLFR